MKIKKILFLVVSVYLILVGCSVQTPKTESVDDSDVIQKENEEIVISFSIVDSDKYAMLSISKDAPEYIVFRYSTSKNVEVVIPDNMSDSWSKFTYSYYLRGGSDENEGLDLNYVKFEDDNSKYEIFQEYTSENDSKSVGLRIISKSTNEETILEASKNSVKGDLIKLRDNTKIKIEVQ